MAESNLVYRSCSSSSSSSSPLGYEIQRIRELIEEPIRMKDFNGFLHPFVKRKKFGNTFFLEGNFS
uniref:Uncharacterized protein n=1 Tax=Medicago truncatula TaxID=3880 RepID=A2Q5Q0_MEDTR|nr:hypothetical protein MtrDRAFT_AC167711g5v2 [Medicago truncatula]